MGPQAVKYHPPAELLDNITSTRTSRRKRRVARLRQTVIGHAEELRKRAEDLWLDIADVADSHSRLFLGSIDDSIPLDELVRDAVGERRTEGHGRHGSRGRDFPGSVPEPGVCEAPSSLGVAENLDPEEGKQRSPSAPRVGRGSQGSEHTDSRGPSFFGGDNLSRSQSGPGRRFEEPSLRAVGPEADPGREVAAPNEAPQRGDSRLAQNLQGAAIPLHEIDDKSDKDESFEILHHSG